MPTEGRIDRVDVTEASDTSPAAQLGRIDISEAADTAPAALVERSDTAVVWIELSEFPLGGLSAGSARRVDQVLAARNKHFGIQ